MKIGSAYERLDFSCIHTEYVLMIQVLLFKDSDTIENFLQHNVVCFHAVCHYPAQRSLVSVSLSSYSSVTDRVILPVQRDGVTDLHEVRLALKVQFACDLIKVTHHISRHNSIRAAYYKNIVSVHLKLP